MREEITISLTRTMGSRHARVRVAVAPRPGEPGCAYTVGSVRLHSATSLDRDTAHLLAEDLLDDLATQQLLRGEVDQAQEELPWA